MYLNMIDIVLLTDVSSIRICADVLGIIRDKSIQVCGHNPALTFEELT